MATHPRRETVSLEAYPDLVVIYLGMKAKSIKGLKTLLSFAPRIEEAVDQDPDGLLCHEWITYSLIPPHRGMRQYWRDFDSLEAWARSLPHEEWWRTYVQDTAGTGFWHEAYSRRHGMESVYVDMDPVGFMRFGEAEPARGTMFSARDRMGVAGEETRDAPVAEDEMYAS